VSLILVSADPRSYYVWTHQAVNPDSTKKSSPALSPKSHWNYCNAFDSLKSWKTPLLKASRLVPAVHGRLSLIIPTKSYSGVRTRRVAKFPVGNVEKWNIYLKAVKVSYLFVPADNRIRGILKRRQEACGGRCNVGSVNQEMPEMRETIHQGLGV